jgi:phosphonate transport system permease protein
MTNKDKQISGGMELLVVTRRKRRLYIALGILGIIGLAFWAAWGTGFNIPKLVSGFPKIYNFLSRLFPPAAYFLPKVLKPTIETLQMALLGTTIPIFFAIPLALLAAANTGPNRPVTFLIRMLLNFLRTVPELVWALLLVTVVGLGAFPGVLALTLHTIGGLGKLYAEAIEAVNPGVIEGIEATGAKRYKVILFGILPSCLPLMISTTLLYWEYNNRTSTILGLVGAGGIGLALTHAIEDFRYHDAVTCLIIIVLILSVIDRISAKLRARVI